MKWISIGTCLVALVAIGIFTLDLTAGESTKKKSDSAELYELRKGLQTRERSLIGRERELERKEQAVKDKEKILQTQLARYEKIIRDLNEKLKKARKFELDRVASLKKIYEKMEPKRAAKILNGMGVELASGLLADMRKEQAAQILGRMSSSKARKVSERMLEIRLGPSRTLSSQTSKP